MKTSLFSTRQRRHFPLFTFLFSLFSSALAASAASPIVCSPYTFVGRITDSAHVAFDADRVATFTATELDGTPLARAKTFFRDDTTHNYALVIPMADSAMPGCALLGETIAVAVTDPAGRKWSAVIDPATIGTPGTVAVVDIVLAEDADGDGIDDQLFRNLLAGWENSDAFDPDATYDPHADSDGDGISDLDEAYLGTNPFSAADVLSIQSFSASPMSLMFDSAGGRTFAVETSSSLVPGDADWSPVPIATDSSAKSSDRTLYTIPASSKATTHTLYLFPTSSPAFFRLAPR